MKSYLKSAESNCQLSIPHPVKMYLKNKVEIKTFLEKQKLRQFTVTRIALEGMLKKAL